MTTRHIAVQPASGKGAVVVVEVKQEGSDELDIRIVGCEGESPYLTSIKQRDVKKLKHKFKGSDDEWAIILSYFLLQKSPDQKQVGLLDDVRMLYTLKDENLELSFRQDVQGIKVTLGEIILPRDEDFEFNPFEWAQASAQAHAQTLKEFADFKSRASSEQDARAKLNAQLEDFIKGKNETENAMLQQFMELLNEKKRKIRDQSRLLAGASVNPSTATAIQSKRTNEKPRKPGASRTSKRKASVQAAPPVPEVESDSDKMEVDQVKEGEQDSDDEVPAVATPDRSDDETEGEDDSTAPHVTGKPAEVVGSSSIAKSSKGEDADSQGVPPPRALPFGRRATRSKDVETPLTVADDGEDDDTEDEEL